MLFDVTIYYLWVVGSDLPGRRLAVGFVDIQSFPVLSLVGLCLRKSRNCSKHQ
jgi:hypothetical protein